MFLVPPRALLGREGRTGKTLRKGRGAISKKRERAPKGEHAAVLEMDENCQISVERPRYATKREKKKTSGKENLKKEEERVARGWQSTYEQVSVAWGKRDIERPGKSQSEPMKP